MLQQERSLENVRKETRRIEDVLAREGMDAVQKLPRRTNNLALFEALLSHSWSLRHEEPALMESFAWLAVQQAQRMDARFYGQRQVSDFQGRALAELGNAYRVTDKFTEAAWAFGCAQEVYELGTGDEPLAIRLLELEASLNSDLRQFDVALIRLEKILRFHRRNENEHLTGRTLVLKGLYTGYSGKPEEAVRLLTEGLSLVDQALDPIVTFSAVHNQIWFLVECGEFRKAKRLRVEKSRELSLGSGRLNDLRLRWLEARIDYGLGNRQRAEASLREVQQGFREVPRRYDDALVGLDLATVLLDQGKITEAHHVAESAVKVFLALGIKTEAIAAIILIRLAFEMNRATVDLLQNVADYMRHADYGPHKPFTPPEL